MRGLCCFGLLLALAPTSLAAGHEDEPHCEPVYGYTNYTTPSAGYFISDDNSSSCAAPGGCDHLPAGSVIDEDGEFCPYGMTWANHTGHSEEDCIHLAEFTSEADAPPELHMNGLQGLFFSHDPESECSIGCPAEAGFIPDGDPPGFKAGMWCLDPKPDDDGYEHAYRCTPVAQNATAPVAGILFTTNHDGEEGMVAVAAGDRAPTGGLWCPHGEHPDDTREFSAMTAPMEYEAEYEWATEVWLETASFTFFLEISGKTIEDALSSYDSYVSAIGEAIHYITGWEGTDLDISFYALPGGFDEGRYLGMLWEKKNGYEEWVHEMFGGHDWHDNGPHVSDWHDYDPHGSSSGSGSGSSSGWDDGSGNGSDSGSSSGSDYSRRLDGHDSIVLVVTIMDQGEDSKSPYDIAEPVLYSGMFAWAFAEALTSVGDAMDSVQVVVHEGLNMPEVGFMEEYEGESACIDTPECRERIPHGGYEHEWDWCRWLNSDRNTEACRAACRKDPHESFTYRLFTESCSTDPIDHREEGACPMTCAPKADRISHHSCFESEASFRKIENWDFRGDTFGPEHEMRRAAELEGFETEDSCTGRGFYWHAWSCASTQRFYHRKLPAFFYEHHDGMCGDHRRWFTEVCCDDAEDEPQHHRSYSGSGKCDALGDKMCNGKSINDYAHACIAVLMSKPSCNEFQGEDAEGMPIEKCGRHVALCDAPECVAHRQCAVKALEEEGCMDSDAAAARRLRQVIDGAIKTCPTDSRPTKCVHASTEVAHRRNEFYCGKADGEWYGGGSGSGSGSGGGSGAHHEGPTAAMHEQYHHEQYYPGDEGSDDGWEEEGSDSGWKDDGSSNGSSHGSSGDW